MTTTFVSDAWRGPPRPCVWCAVPCWDAWQECNKHSSRNPWRGRAWQRMRASIEMHDRWTAQYTRRHPEHGNGRVWSGLRAARLRWFWRGGGRFGWQPNFERYWGLRPRHVPLGEAIRRAGLTNEQAAAAVIRADEIGILPRRRA